MANTFSWHLSVPPEVLCEKAGTTLREYYLVPAVRLETHKRARSHFIERLDFDLGVSVGSGLTSYWNATLFGAEIEFPANHQATVHKRVLTNLDNVSELQPPRADEISSLPRYRELLDQYAKMEHLVEGSEWRVSFGTFPLQGPFTTAIILRGSELITPSRVVICF